MLDLNNLYKGDCLELMKDIDDKSIDMILCDLPYEITNCKWDIIIPFKPLWKQYKRIIKPNGAIVLTASQPFTSLLVNSNIDMFKYSLVWEKTTATGHLNAKRMPMRAHEDVLVFYNNPPTYNPQKTTGHKRKVAVADRAKKLSDVYGSQVGVTKYDSTERYPRSVIKTTTDKQKSKLHPTQKPVCLFEYFIKTYTNENEIVLDNCAGSGTTGISSINTNRKYILMEDKQKYCDIIIERIKQRKEEDK